MLVLVLAVALPPLPPLPALALLALVEPVALELATLLELLELLAPAPGGSPQKPSVQQTPAQHCASYAQFMSSGVQVPPPG